METRIQALGYELHTAKECIDDLVEICRWRDSKLGNGTNGRNTNGSCVVNVDNTVGEQDEDQKIASTLDEKCEIRNAKNEPNEGENATASITAQENVIADGPNTKYHQDHPNQTSLIGLTTFELEAIQIAWPYITTRLTTASDVLHLANYTKQLNETEWKPILKMIYHYIFLANQNRSSELIDRDTRLDDDWYTEPWYCISIPRFGIPSSSAASGNEAGATAKIDDLIDMLPYLARMGFRNLYVMSHYESSMGDDGFDVKAYRARASLGGEAAWTNFLNIATTRGFRVCTDAVFNHVSVEHDWFVSAVIKGQPQYLPFFIQRNGRAKINELDVDGDIICVYKNEDGSVEKQVCNMPDIDRTHGLWCEIKGQTYQFYRSFYPFQIDLNLQCPLVLEQLFLILSYELNQGILAKRLDAIPHWVKKAGFTNDGLPETHALVSILKIFTRHICPKAIFIPEAVRGIELACKYTGSDISIRKSGVGMPSEGDLVYNFEMQAALRETMIFGNSVPFWKRVGTSMRTKTVGMPKKAHWLNVLDHHDEIFMGFFDPSLRTQISEYIESRKGLVYKNGMSAVLTTSHMVDSDPKRLAVALCCLYLAPGVPMIYYGMELLQKTSHTSVDSLSDKSYSSAAGSVGRGSSYTSSSNSNLRTSSTISDYQDPQHVGISTNSGGNSASTAHEGSMTLVDRERFVQYSTESRRKVFESFGLKSDGFDPRDYHRMPIPKAWFYESLQGNAWPARVVRTMNRLRSQYPALGVSAHVEYLPCDVASVMCMLRTVDADPSLAADSADDEHMCRSLLCIVNLSRIDFECFIQAEKVLNLWKIPRSNKSARCVDLLASVDIEPCDDDGVVLEHAADSSRYPIVTDRRDEILSIHLSGDQGSGARVIHKMVAGSSIQILHAFGANHGD